MLLQVAIKHHECKQNEGNRGSCSIYHYSRLFSLMSSCFSYILSPIPLRYNVTMSSEDDPRNGDYH